MYKSKVQPVPTEFCDNGALGAILHLLPMGGQPGCTGELERVRLRAGAVTTVGLCALACLLRLLLALTLDSLRRLRTEPLGITSVHGRTRTQVNRTGTRVGLCALEFLPILLVASTLETPRRLGVARELRFHRLVLRVGWHQRLALPRGHRSRLVRKGRGRGPRVCRHVAFQIVLRWGLRCCPLEKGGCQLGLPGCQLELRRESNPRFVPRRSEPRVTPRWR